MSDDYAVDLRLVILHCSVARWLVEQQWVEQQWVTAGQGSVAVDQYLAIQLVEVVYYLDWCCFLYCV